MSEVKYPVRDEDRRNVMTFFFNIPRKYIDRFTIEELEMIAKQRGYIK